MYNPDEKNGRPRLGRAKKNISFRISCDRDEADIITIKAARAGMPKAVYIRESAVANTFTPLLSGAEKEFIHEIRKLGSNLNQIAKNGARMRLQIGGRECRKHYQRTC